MPDAVPDGEREAAAAAPSRGVAMGVPVPVDDYVRVGEPVDATAGESVLLRVAALDGVAVAAAEPVIAGVPVCEPVRMRCSQSRGCRCCGSSA